MILLAIDSSASLCAACVYDAASSEELGRDTDVATAFERVMDRRFERANKIQQWSEQLCRWEIERAPDADHTGVVARAFALVSEPI